MIKDRLSKVSDPAIVLALVTALSYTLSFMYQANVREYYQLPSYFVELNSTDMISPMFYIIWIILLVWKFFSALAIAFPTLNKLFSRDLSFSIFMTLMITVWVAGWLGQELASQRTEYMVVSQKEGLFVAVSTYKDSIIIAPLNIENESIKPQFTAIEVKDLKNAETVFFEDGLKVEDVKSSKDLNPKEKR